MVIESGEREREKKNGTNEGQPRTRTPAFDVSMRVYTSEPARSLCAMRNTMWMMTFVFFRLQESRTKKSSLSIERRWNGDAATAVAGKKNERVSKKCYTQGLMFKQMSIRKPRFQGFLFLSSLPWSLFISPVSFLHTNRWRQETKKFVLSLFFLLFCGNQSYK